MNNISKKQKTYWSKRFIRVAKFAIAVAGALLGIQGLWNLTLQNHSGHGDNVEGDKIVIESHGPAGLRLKDSTIGNFQGNIVEGMSMDDNSAIGSMDGNLIKK